MTDQPTLDAPDEPIERHPLDETSNDLAVERIRAMKRMVAEKQEEAGP